MKIKKEGRKKRGKEQRKGKKEGKKERRKEIRKKLTVKIYYVPGAVNCPREYNIINTSCVFVISCYITNPLRMEMKYKCYNRDIEKDLGNIREETTYYKIIYILRGRSDKYS